MDRQRIVFLDNLNLESSHLKKLKQLGRVVQFTSDYPNENEAINRAKEATILVSKWVYVSEKILTASKNLKYVVMAMTGYHDWVDIKEAQKFNIKVSNVPAFSTEAVAEHVFMLLLALSRKLLPANYALLKGNFNPKSHQGSELKNKTLGIIGFGHIGKKVAEIARSFGMKILTVNSKSQREDLEKLLKNSRIISLHVPLTDKTHHLIGRKEITLLPKGAIIINTSRGKVIDEKALVDYLKNGYLKGAGLDVFYQEPPNINNPLFSLPNVIATPHIAYNTKEAYGRLNDGIIENIKSYLSGKPINLVS